MEAGSTYVPSYGYYYNPQSYHQPMMYYAIPQPLPPQVQQQPTAEGTMPVPQVYPVLVPPVQVLPEPNQEPAATLNIQEQAPASAPESCCVDEEQGGPQDHVSPLYNLQQELLLKQELMIRRRLAFFLLVGLLNLLVYSFFIPVSLFAVFLAASFYLFGTVAIQMRSRFCLIVFALLHLIAFYNLGTVIYMVVAAPQGMVVSWPFLIWLNLATFSKVGSFCGSLRYSCFLRMATKA